MHLFLSSRTEYGQTHFCHRRRRQLLGQRAYERRIGMLLESRGLSVRMQKLDPYINVDPGHDEPVPARRSVRAR